MSYKSAQDVDDNISQTIQDSAKVYERQIGNRISKLLNGNNFNDPE